MTNLEIKTNLQSIIAKIDANRLEIWNNELTDTIESIIIQDDCSNEDIARYNGWLHDLEDLINKIG
jgi:hypothetical protein